MISKPREISKLIFFFSPTELERVLKYIFSSSYPPWLILCEEKPEKSQSIVIFKTLFLIRDSSGAA